MSDIIHTTQLDKHNRLIVRDVPENAPDRYIWRIEFLDDSSDYYGSCSEGVWFESVAAAIASGHTYHLMELVTEDAGE